MSDDELQPSRASRSARVEKRWKIQAAVVAGLVILLIVIAMLAGNSGGTPSASPAPPPTTAPSGAVQPSDLLAFSITGAPSALAATIGGGEQRSSAAVIVPPNLTFVMPGAGEMNSDRIQDLPGEEMRLGVSNIGGAWDGHYATIDLERFGGVVDRLGGLTVDLSDVYPAGAEALGPGPTRLSGAQVVSLLRTRSDDTV